jgi:hypothetical protein
MQLLNIIIFTFTILFVSIEARRRTDPLYSQMLQTHKIHRVKWRNEFGSQSKSKKKSKRNFDSKNINDDDTLFYIQSKPQSDLQTLTTSSVHFVNYDQIDCTQGGARCIQRHTEGTEEQTITVEALTNTEVDCDTDFESGETQSNRFLRCITFGSNTIRVSCQHPSNSFVEINFQGISSNSFKAENGALARFLFGGIPTGEWKTQGYYQSTSAIVEVYCP